MIIYPANFPSKLGRRMAKMTKNELLDLADLLDIDVPLEVDELDAIRQALVDGMTQIDKRDYGR